ncbi:MAG: L-glutamate gamma-semialdehyde dehydrogenase, partial [Planctomycetota bacterium]
SLNPSDKSQVVGRVCMADVEHVDRAVAAAREAFDGGWSNTSVAERTAGLRSVSAIMRRRRFELAAWMVFEVGKPWREADADVSEAIDFCEYYSLQMERLAERPGRCDFPGETNAYVYQPRGVAAIIAPWNFPLAILTGMTSAALVSGNCVVMKPAEQSLVVAAKLMEIFIEAGLAAGVVNYLPGLGEVIGARLVEHADVDMIAFTGSREIGVSIYEQASKWRPGQRGLKRVIAEMGGKNAIIVDADADLDEAVAGIIASAFEYTGQKCSACSRVVVHQSVKEQLLDRLVEAIRSVPMGPADEPQTFVGPLVDEDARKKTLGYIELGKQEGRQVCSVEPGELADLGFFVPVTIFSDVEPAAHIAREEIFGPVLSVIAVESLDAALEVANGTEYALTGGLYSRSPSNIEQVRQRFNVGNLYINRKITGALVGRQPFGGFKMSGIGSKAGGPDYLLQFMEPKTITENTFRHGCVPESV